MLKLEVVKRKINESLQDYGTACVKNNQFKYLDKEVQELLLSAPGKSKYKNVTIYSLHDSSITSDYEEPVGWAGKILSEIDAAMADSNFEPMEVA